MMVHVFKAGALIYNNFVSSKSKDSITSSYFDVALDSDGTGTMIGNSGNGYARITLVE